MNKTLIKCLILFSAFHFFGNFTIAQIKNSNQMQGDQFGIERNRDEFKLGQRIEMLTNRLGLDSNQIEKIKVIERQNLEEEQRRRERDSFGNDGKANSQNFGGNGFAPSPEQRALYLDFIKLRKEANDKISGLLTKKQSTKFASIRERDVKILEDRMNGIRPGSQQMNNSVKNRNTQVPVLKNKKQKAKKNSVPN